MISRGWPAPAKLNLFLHVTGRRDDGYHNIQTAMQMLDHGDQLDFHPRDDKRIRISSNSREIPGQDLCVHAASLLQTSSGTHQGVDIKLRKLLPVGSGLGGGSSDAATCLVALNQLWRLGMDTETLARLGLCLGADVPFFVRGRSAIAEGAGELLTPMPLEKCCFLVAWTGVQVSTGTVYQSPHLTRDTEPRKISSWPAEVEPRNDFTEVTCKLYPEVGELLSFMRKLEDAAIGKAAMSGSGGSVFLAFADAREAGKALAKLPQQWYGFVARGVDESPLARTG